jgi:anti-sigma-K factor RskA
VSAEEPARERKCGDDVAAYALGALSEDEARAFRRHLEQCAICRDELASFQSVVDLLPTSVEPAPAPASLRRRVLREVAAEQRARSPRRTPGVPWLSGWLRPALAAAAVLAVIALVALRVDAMGPPSPHVFRAAVIGGGSAELRVSGGGSELVVHHMAPPPYGKIYEVWLKHRSGAPLPTTALFSVTSGGDGDIGVPGNLAGVSEVMVTPEPLGGSRVPTHPPVLTVRL